MSSRSVFPSDTAPDIMAFFESWEDLPLDGGSGPGLVPRLSDYLDAAPPNLQPNVTIVDVYGPDRMVVRLFGTGLETISGLAPTTHDLMTLYGPEVRAMAQRLVWTTVSHPTGYVCTRHVRTKSGLILDCPAIGLPIGVDDPNMKCFITYASIANAKDALAARDSFVVVQDVRFEHWIDIGAGTPDSAP
ncbi:MAG: hypothetical protein JNK21_05000 [Rhodospirillaceae bacterium]|nr:hypothetical protein [Rhodospirillaceae bacterium]